MLDACKSRITWLLHFFPTKKKRYAYYELRWLDKQKFYSYKILLEVFIAYLSKCCHKTKNISIKYIQPTIFYGNKKIFTVILYASSQTHDKLSYLFSLSCARPITEKLNFYSEK